MSSPTPETFKLNEGFQVLSLTSSHLPAAGFVGDTGHVCRHCCVDTRIHNVLSVLGNAAPARSLAQNCKQFHRISPHTDIVNMLSYVDLDLGQR